MKFDSVGGLTNHIQSLKEMVVFPLLYPEVFEKFKIQPPRWEQTVTVHVKTGIYLCLNGMRALCHACRSPAKLLNVNVKLI